MAIERVQNGVLWEERATTPEDARALHEKHSKALQEHGAREFQRQWGENAAVGFDKMTKPDGSTELVRRDRVDAALEAGWGGSAAPRMTVPALPWQADRLVGERYEDYMRRKSEKA